MSTASMPARADLARDAYEDHMFTLWTQAEEVTQGYMVNDVAAQRGIRGADLYLPGKGRAPESCASNELRECWDHGLAPRPVSFAAFQSANRPAEPERTTMSKVAEQLVDLRGLAHQLGITYGSARTAKLRGRLPAADYLVGQSPAWTQATVDAYLAARPVRGFK